MLLRLNALVNVPERVDLILDLDLPGSLPSTEVTDVEDEVVVVLRTVPEADEVELEGASGPGDNPRGVGLAILDAKVG